MTTAVMAVRAIQ